VLQIEMLKQVPRPPYRIELYDVLQIHVLGTIPKQPIDGYYLVEGDGIVTLGPPYGVVRLAGMTIEAATAEMTRHLQVILQHPDVSIQLSRSSSTQQITGSHVVQPDGTVNLRSCGMVHVAGKTVTESRQAIEQQLAQYFDSPQVSVDILGFNSKYYYVIVAGAETSENIQRLPITGNETVLDALARIQGLSQISSKTMWVARPTPADVGSEAILPVDFVGITHGLTDTNYQLLPGDRLYVVDDQLVAADNYLAKLTRPIERLLNISILGTSTTRNMQTLGRSYNKTRY
jgi:polysaccharide export outer membrane protein